MPSKPPDDDDKTAPAAPRAARDNQDPTETREALRISDAPTVERSALELPSSDEATETKDLPPAKAQPKSKAAPRAPDPETRDLKPRSAPRPGRPGGQPSKDDASFAGVSLKRGFPPEEIVKQLSMRGVDENAARALVHAAQDRLLAQGIRPGAASGRGSNDVLIGVVMIAFSIVLTAGTWAAARERGGGMYLVLWGPAVFGVLRLFRGLSRR